MNALTDPKDIIIELRNVIAARGLKPQDIVLMLENAKTPVSESTIRRIMRDGSEDADFSFKNVIMPLSNLLLDLNKHNEDDTVEVTAMKELLLTKRELIEKLETRITQLKEEKTALEIKNDKDNIKYHEKLEKERQIHAEEIKKWMHQIELKDARIDKLMDSCDRKDIILNKLLTKCDNCEFHHK